MLIKGLEVVIAYYDELAARFQGYQQRLRQTFSDVSEKEKTHLKLTSKEFVSSWFHVLLIDVSMQKLVGGTYVDTFNLPTGSSRKNCFNRSVLKDEEGETKPIVGHACPFPQNEKLLGGIWSSRMVLCRRFIFPVKRFVRPEKRRSCWEIPQRSLKNNPRHGWRRTISSYSILIG